MQDILQDLDASPPCKQPSSTLSASQSLPDNAAAANAGASANAKGSSDCDDCGDQLVATTSAKVTPSQTSCSLVVDVHIQPEAKDVGATTKLCKHSVSRFQRCYSEGAAQASPLVKRKVRTPVGSSR